MKAYCKLGLLESASFRQWQKFASLTLCWLAVSSFGVSGLNSTQAQQGGYSQRANPQAYAPPVHIAPGSATALPPNRHRPRQTPGLALAKTQPSGEAVGIQDRLAQQFSRQASNPTLEREIPVGPARSEVVGGGLVRAPRLARVQPAQRKAYSSYESRGELSRQANDVQDQNAVRASPSAAGQGNDYPTGNSVMETGDEWDADDRDPSTLQPVQPVTAQEIHQEPAPVRHAFVQEQHLRNPPPRVARETQEFEQFDQEFEWVEETPQLPQLNRGDRAQSPRQQVPARPTSVLRRQDQDSNDLQFQPQRSNPAEQEPRSDFQRELEQLDRQFEGGRVPNPQADRPRSLLDQNRMGNEDQDGDSNADQKSKTSLLDQSCDEFRADLLNTSIRDIALDISPPAINTDRNLTGISRSWTDRNGQIIATGTLVDLRRGYVFLDNGQKIAFARLSESDLAAVSEYWNLPKSCLVASRGTIDRCWQPQTYQWTASSLCHKPLYFENIQLERYGHTHGPIMQPVRSVAHFFVSLATLPYQTAMYPPNECQYPLGLYRPGDCAPWLKDPIPISLDGMRRQALITTGFAFIP